jgi:ubiquinone/menaquinone biosynthesis C-methylase UbiE
MPLSPELISRTTFAMTESQNRPNPQRIMDMSCAFYDACVLHSASDAGVFATLAETPGLSAEALAENLALDGRATRLLLDACVALELLVKDDGQYANSPEAAAFLAPGPMDLSGALRYNRDVYPLWGQLPKLLKTGSPVESPDVHLGQDAERTQSFVRSMHERALAIGRGAVHFIDLSASKNVLDIGGGAGAFASLFASKHTATQFTVLDLPDVVAFGPEFLKDCEGLDRITYLPGSYRELEFPAGHDTVLILGVLHQESPESILDILTRAGDVLSSGDRIIVMDMMTDATRTQPSFSALFALNMALSADHGWVFSDEDLQGWLTQAGFDDYTCRPLPPPLPHWLATATKI